MSKKTANIPSYSVLMSVYKKENPDFLRESMQSIYGQTVPTDDFVLVCDGPLTKELEDVINEMKIKFGERLRIARLEKNYGLGYALNVGIQKCKNDIIARMDSDDVSVKERIEKELKAMMRMGVDVVGSNIIEYDETMTNFIGLKNVPEKNEDIKKYAKKRNPMNHMTVCYKKNAVMECGNYKTMLGFEDYYLWVRMIENGSSFFNIQEPLVEVRAGMNMIKRRGGLVYYKRMRKFEKTLKQIGFISPIEYYAIVFIKSVASLAPSSLRGLFYRRVLRVK